MKISVDFLSLSNEPQNFKIEAPYLAHKLQCSEQRRDLIFLKGSYHANFLKDFFFLVTASSSTICLNCTGCNHSCTDNASNEKA